MIYFVKNTIKKQTNKTNMKDLLTKYCASEIRDIKKKKPKLHPKEINLRNKEIFDKSFFGKRNLNKK